MTVTTQVRFEDEGKLEETIIHAFNHGTLVKGFYQTLKAISLYHTNPVEKIVIGGSLDANYMSVLSSLLEKTKVQVPVVYIQNKLLVSTAIRKAEEANGKNPRAPFVCRLFCILKQLKGSSQQ